MIYNWHETVRTHFLLFQWNINKSLLSYPMQNSKILGHKVTPKLELKNWPSKAKIVLFLLTKKFDQKRRPEQTPCVYLTTQRSGFGIETTAWTHRTSRKISSEKSSDASHAAGRQLGHQEEVVEEERPEGKKSVKEKDGWGAEGQCN